MFKDRLPTPLTPLDPLHRTHFSADDSFTRVVVCGDRFALAKAISSGNGKTLK